MFSQFAKWFAGIPQQSIEYHGKELKMELIHRGINCQISIQCIDREQYGLGMTSNEPLDEADIACIHRYLLSEGFIARALSC